MKNNLFTFTFLCAAALVAGTLPSLAFEVSEGDVFCWGYEEATHSCYALVTTGAVKGGRYEATAVTTVILSDEFRIRSSESYEYEIRDGLHCLVEYDILSIEPIGHAPFADFGATMERLNRALMAQGYCFDIQPCGDDIIGENYIAGRRNGDFDMLGRQFSADDHLLPKLRLRWDEPQMGQALEGIAACRPI